MKQLLDEISFEFNLRNHLIRRFVEEGVRAEEELCAFFCKQPIPEEEKSKDNPEHHDRCIRFHDAQVELRLAARYMGLP